MNRAIIVDDEAIGINTLKIMIEKVAPDVKVVATSTDPENAVSLIEDYRPDIVFIDISMPKLNGFDLLDRIGQRNFKVVFTTAHEEYALKAIKIKADDYLLKPIDADELRQCMANIVASGRKADTADKPAANIIELSVRDGIIFIRPKDIIRLEADGSYTTFYLDNNVKHIASKNLKECESLILASYFFRCHSSHVINLKKVVKMVSSDGLYALMTDGSMPEIGRKHKDTFLEKLKAI
jgi:two-component system, LytTR family, response regulator